MSDQTRVRSRLFLHSGGNLASALHDAADFLAGAENAVFLPYALHELEVYTTEMSAAFRNIGVELIGLHRFPDPVGALQGVDAIVVGGGNTFRLAKALQQLGLVAPIRQAVERGARYWGSSAGSNVASPTIRTTNDMPIVEPSSFNALDLIPFQINPHYIDSGGDAVGETRDVRIKEFLEENDVTVVGLREGSWLVANGRSLMLHGDAGAVMFRRGMRPSVLEPQSNVSFLLDEPSIFDHPLPTFGRRVTP